MYRFVVCAAASALCLCASAHAEQATEIWLQDIPDQGVVDPLDLRWQSAIVTSFPTSIYERQLNGPDSSDRANGWATAYGPGAFKLQMEHENANGGWTNNVFMKDASAGATTVTDLVFTDLDNPGGGGFINVAISAIAFTSTYEQLGAQVMLADAVFRGEFNGVQTSVADVSGFTGGTATSTFVTVPLDVPVTFTFSASASMGMHSPGSSWTDPVHPKAGHIFEVQPAATPFVFSGGAGNYTANSVCFNINDNVYEVPGPGGSLLAMAGGLIAIRRRRSVPRV